MWQIMANKSCLFAQKYNIVIPNLKDGTHYISWNSKEELKDKIIYYLNNKNELEKIISESHKNIILNHTSESRVEYIFNKIL
jgi:spore maturation protein CgeB